MFTDKPCLGCEFSEEINCQEIAGSECEEGGSFIWALDGSKE